MSKAKQKRRAVPSRSNRLEVAILPIEEYEGIVEDLEHLLTALEIREGKVRGHGKRVPWEFLKAKHGL